MPSILNRALEAYSSHSDRMNTMKFNELAQRRFEQNREQTQIRAEQRADDRMKQTPGYKLNEMNLEKAQRQDKFYKSIREDEKTRRKFFAPPPSLKKDLGDDYDSTRYEELADMAMTDTETAIVMKYDYDNKMLQEVLNRKGEDRNFENRKTLLGLEHDNARSLIEYRDEIDASADDRKMTNNIRLMILTQALANRTLDKHELSNLIGEVQTSIRDGIDRYTASNIGTDDKNQEKRQSVGAELEAAVDRVTSRMLNRQNPPKGYETWWDYEADTYESKNGNLFKQGMNFIKGDAMLRDNFVYMAALGQARETAPVFKESRNIDQLLGIAKDAFPDLNFGIGGSPPHASPATGDVPAGAMMRPGGAGGSYADGAMPPLSGAPGVAGSTAAAGSSGMMKQLMQMMINNPTTGIPGGLNNVDIDATMKNIAPNIPSAPNLNIPPTGAPKNGLYTKGLGIGKPVSKAPQPIDLGRLPEMFLEMLEATRKVTNRSPQSRARYEKSATPTKKEAKELIEKSANGSIDQNLFPSGHSKPPAASYKPRESRDNRETVTSRDSGSVIQNMIPKDTRSKKDGYTPNSSKIVFEETSGDFSGVDKELKKQMPVISQIAKAYNVDMKLMMSLLKRITRSKDKKDRLTIDMITHPHFPRMMDSLAKFLSKKENADSLRGFTD